MQTNIENNRCTSLDFVARLTKGNPVMMREMIEVYLEETPRLLNGMKQAIESRDWDSLSRVAHAMIPSFSTVGISIEFADMTRIIQELAEKRENPGLIEENFVKVDGVCRQAREELKKELISLETK